MMAVLSPGSGVSDKAVARSFLPSLLMSVNLPASGLSSDLASGLPVSGFAASGPVTVEHLRPRAPMGELLHYVRAAGWLVPTDGV